MIAMITILMMMMIRFRGSMIGDHVYHDHDDCDEYVGASVYVETPPQLVISAVPHREAIVAHCRWRL